MWVDEAVPFHAFSLGYRMPHQTSTDASTGDDPCRRCVGRQSCGCNAGPEGCHRAVPPLAEEEALKRKGLIKEHGQPAQLPSKLRTPLSERVRSPPDANISWVVYGASWDPQDAT